MALNPYKLMGALEPKQVALNSLELAFRRAVMEAADRESREMLEAMARLEKLRRTNPRRYWKLID